MRRGPLRRLLAARGGRDRTGKAPAPSGVPLLPRHGPLDLSPNQRHDWLHYQEFGDTPLYDAMLLRLRGPPRVPALRTALRALLARHESLRTRFPVLDGAPRQVIEPTDRISVPFVDFSALPTDADRERELRELHRAALSGYALDRRPPCRFALVGFAPADHLLVLSIPHIAADFWSIPLLSQELSALYQAASAGRPAEPRAHGHDYADYAAWEAAQWSPQARAEELLGWQRRLRGITALPLPADHPRSTGIPARSWTHAENLDPTVSDRLRAWSRRENVTLFVTLLAAFHCLLARVCGVDTMVTASSSANRGSNLATALVGPLSDYLVIPNDLTGDPDFREVLHRTSDAVLRARDRKNMPRDDLVQGLDPARELRPHPLKQVYFNLLAAPRAEARLSSGLSATLVSLDDGPRGPHLVPEHADLSVNCFDYGAGPLVCQLRCTAELYTAGAGPRWLRWYGTVVRQILERPDIRLSRIRPQAAGEAITRAAVPRPRTRCAADWMAKNAGRIDARLLDIWAQAVGPGHRSGEFFQNGRTDVDAAVLLKRIEEEHGVRIALTDFLRAPTLTTLVTAWTADTPPSKEHG
ncbi:condensation domain-containing protein [Streptomyces sp. WZ-12]|uniref:condensation domain-containing protein n=1 Tax=Streptomyces sp. WZ-12 TaxID=3030210 RepID=UPI00238116ED|nr:condensation domain-containing protein [Streptomyces sp. WZ-12]